MNDKSNNKKLGIFTVVCRGVVSRQQFLEKWRF